jgi:hypothetical protein
MCLATMPPAGELAELKAFDDAVRASIAKSIADGTIDPRELCLAMVTRGVGMDDALVQAALAATAPEVKQLADIHARRLQAGSGMYAKTGTGLATPLRKMYEVNVGGANAAPKPAVPKK